MAQKMNQQMKVAIIAIDRNVWLRQDAVFSSLLYFCGLHLPFIPPPSAVKQPQLLGADTAWAGLYILGINIFGLRPFTPVSESTGDIFQFRENTLPL